MPLTLLQNKIFIVIVAWKVGILSFSFDQGSW